MRKLNFRRQYPLFSNKIVALLAFSWLFLPQSNLYAQIEIHQPFYDYSQQLHFGFTLGTNFSRFDYRLSEEFFSNDSLQNITNTSFPGLTIGAVGNWHVTERFNLRFLPSLILNQRDLNYHFSSGQTESLGIESVLVEFPLTAKFKATRHNNIRFYILGGGKYGFDIASEEDAVVNVATPIVALKRHNLSYEFGLGFDIYFPYFKFSPELKFSNGINNILAEDSGYYTRMLDGLFPRFFFVNLHFEG